MPTEACASVPSPEAKFAFNIGFHAYIVLCGVSGLFFFLFFFRAAVQTEFGGKGRSAERGKEREG
jgi:hypothetical protein